jgi:hypothetical protein
MSIKLTDTQIVMLSAASQRDDRCLVAPRNLKGGAAHGSAEGATWKAAEIPSCPLLAPLNAQVSEVPHGLLDFARSKAASA